VDVAQYIPTPWFAQLECIAIIPLTFTKRRIPGILIGIEQLRRLRRIWGK
jgi:hypothetical protein